MQYIDAVLCPEVAQSISRAQEVSLKISLSNTPNICSSFGGRFRAPTSYDTDSDDDASTSSGSQSSVDFDISVESSASSGGEDAEEESEEEILAPFNKLRLNHRTSEEQQQVEEKPIPILALGVRPKKDDVGNIIIIIIIINDKRNLHSHFYTQIIIKF